MPIFEYKCSKCGNIFEELVLKNDQEVECNNCGSKQASKVLSKCRTKMGGDAVMGDVPSASGGGGCASCGGGNCASC